jgi:hypothetical protein
MRVLKVMLAVACVASVISIFRPITRPGGTPGIFLSVINAALFGSAFCGIQKRSAADVEARICGHRGPSCRFSPTVVIGDAEHSDHGNQPGDGVRLSCDCHRLGHRVLAALVEATEGLLHQWLRVNVVKSPSLIDWLRPSRPKVLRFGPCVGKGREAPDPLQFPLQCFSRGKPRSCK